RSGLKPDLTQRLASTPSLGNKKVVSVEELDGVKLNFEDESWILFRPSGTEPLLRIYCEARSFDDVELLLESGRKLFQ
ncbi:MAG: phosphoglucomutase/phosphomannomutase family protein, partial [Candidatus Margulisiibacteriota bacterium]